MRRLSCKEKQPVNEAAFLKSDYRIKKSTEK